MLQLDDKAMKISPGAWASGDRRLKNHLLVLILGGSSTNDDQPRNDGWSHSHITVLLRRLRPNAKPQVNHRHDPRASENIVPSFSLILSPAFMFRKMGCSEITAIR